MIKSVIKEHPLLTAFSLSLICLGGAVVVVATKRSNAMKVGSKGIALIKEFEGCKLESYRDSVGVWTIGYGHTQGVYAGQKISQQEADRLLEQDVNNFAKKVSLLVGGGVNQNQFDALVSFAYNCGIGNLTKSTLLKLVLKNPNDPNIRGEFAKWKYAGGKVLQGLVRRREAEANLYFTAV